MPKVVVTAQVEDPVKWEESFRTHGDLFRSQSVTKPISFATIEGNHVAVCLEPDDLDTCMKALNSPATAEAMAVDGVKRETVKVFVLDKELKV
jgi:hypothetical protein